MTFPNLRAHEGKYTYRSHTIKFSAWPGHTAAVSSSTTATGSLPRSSRYMVFTTSPGSGTPNLSNVAKPTTEPRTSSRVGSRSARMRSAYA